MATTKEDEDEFTLLASELNVRQEAQLPSELHLQIRSLSEHLIIAVTWGWPLDRIQNLLNQGADPNFSNQKGVTPLALAHSKKMNAENNEIRSQYEAIEKILERQPEVISSSKPKKR